MKLNSSQIKTSLAQNLLETYGPYPEQTWLQFFTDSRVKKEKALFIALKGENFDAHEFLDQAYQNGAKAFLVEKKAFEDLNIKSKAWFSDAHFFIVKDTVFALQQVASFYVKTLDLLKVAITGTSGKTSAKYFAHQLLEGDIDHYFSPKSFNNHIGVPLTLLELQKNHKAALIEIGMNRPGEIEALAELCQPNVCAVTMVGRGHLEGVGTIENVLIEKMSLYKFGQKHIVNIDDERIKNFYDKNIQIQNNKISRIDISSKQECAEIFLKIIESDFNSFTVKGHILGSASEIRIPISGNHHVTNVLIASAVAASAGMPAERIWEKLSQLQVFWGRNEILTSHENIKFYFDAYNANPESMKAFFEQTNQLDQAANFIVGEMLEMGAHAPELHYELGVLAARSKHKKIWFIGPSAKHFERGFLTAGNQKNLVISVTYEQSLALEYKSMLQPQDWVALKASRGIGLEKFLKEFKF